MIFVTLGTQDKSFARLLRAIDKEIKAGTINEKVVVQAGYTKYESKNMEIFDLISPDKFDELMSEADLVITHGGAGSILTAIKKDKKVIVAPRLKRYKEHTNDHQKEIIEEFAKDGYILPLYDFSMLGKLIKKSKTFNPKKFKSNTANMIKLVENYIEEDNHTSWYNKYNFVFKYFIFMALYTLIYYILDNTIYLELYKNIDFVETIGRILFLIRPLLFFTIAYFIEEILIFKVNNKIGKRILLFIFFIITNGFVFAVFKYSNPYILYPIFFIYSLLLNKFIIFRRSEDDLLEKYICKYIEIDEDKK